MVRCPWPMPGWGYLPGARPAAVEPDQELVVHPRYHLVRQGRGHTCSGLRAPLKIVPAVADVWRLPPKCLVPAGAK